MFRSIPTILCQIEFQLADFSAELLSVISAIEVKPIDLFEIKGKHPIEVVVQDRVTCEEFRSVPSLLVCI